MSIDLIGGDKGGNWYPRILDAPPLFFGRTDDLPVHLRHPHVLHVAILRKEIQDPTAVHLRDVAKAVKGQVELVSALGTEDFYSGWCLTVGTARMFENAGIMLSEEERRRWLDVPSVAGDAWGLRGWKRGRGPSKYSRLELTTQTNLGAQVYRLERLLVGVMSNAVAGNPTRQARDILEPYVSGVRDMTKKRRSDTLDYTYRRLREQLGPSRWLALYGGQTARKIGARFEREGRLLSGVIPNREGWERGVPEIARELAMLGHLLLLCQRANRLQNSVDASLDLSGLSRLDDPVLIIPAMAAEELMGFGDPETGDQMPSLEVLTDIAVKFDFNAAELYPTIGPLGLHLAAACAIGRHRRGQTGASEAELWGLRGLADRRFDIACFRELRESRVTLRHLWPAGLRGSGASAPPPLLGLSGLSDIPVVLKFRS